jgi:putative flippase GtrA
VVAWLAGAVPNYWLNRSWTWRRTGRPGLRDELLPYLAIIGLTLLLATITTRWADRWLHSVDTSATARVVLVAAVFLAVYVVMFVLRFLLLDRLFGRLHARDRAAERTPRTTKGLP